MTTLISDIKRNPFILAATALTIAQISLGILGTNTDTHPLRYLALPLGLCALGLIFPPMFTLKRHGAVRPGDSYMRTSVVVDRGLFALVRHPQYLGYMCLNATFALTSQRLLTAVLGAGAVILFYLHTLSEERGLIEKFGDDYMRYVGRVPRFNLLPGLQRALFRRSRRHNSH